MMKESSSYCGMDAWAQDGNWRHCGRGVTRWWEGKRTESRDEGKCLGVSL
jgi:hypothetical protein